VDLGPEQVRVELREGRWAASLPNGRMAWFPATAEGHARLSRERRVLRFLGERCSFRAPRLLFESHSGFDLREIVPGRCDPWPLYERVLRDPDLAQRIGSAIGAILVEQYTAISARDAGWLPPPPSWPPARDWLAARLGRVVDDRGLREAAERIIARYEATAVDPADRVLVHGDLGFHNIVADPASDDVVGVF